MDQGIVLIGREQALTATARAEYQHAPRCRSRTVSLSFDPLGRDRRSASGERTDLVRDDTRGIGTGQSFGHKAGCDLGKPAVRGGESGAVIGARDRVAQLGRGARAVAEQITLGDHPDRCPGRIRDAKMPHAEAVHAAEGTIDHLVAGHRLHRRAHDARHRRRVGVDVRVRRGPQQVALGDDAGGPRLVAGDE